MMTTMVLSFYDDMTTSMFGVLFEHFRLHHAWQKKTLS